MAHRREPWRAIDELRVEADYVERPGQRAIVLALADRLEAAVTPSETKLVNIREVLEGHRYQGAEAEVAAIREVLWPGHLSGNR